MEATTSKASQGEDGKSMRIQWLRLVLVFGVAALGVVLTSAVSADPMVVQKKGAPKKKGDADGKNDFEGRARWEWKILDDKGESTKVGTFMAYLDGTIKVGKDQKLIGTFKVQKDDCKVIITEGALKGEMNISMDERKPLKNKGELVRSDGTKAKVVIEIIND